MWSIFMASAANHSARVRTQVLYLFERAQLLAAVCYGFVPNALNPTALLAGRCPADSDQSEEQQAKSESSLGLPILDRISLFSMGGFPKTIVPSDLRYGRWPVQATRIGKWQAFSRAWISVPASVIFPACLPFIDWSTFCPRESSFSA